MKAEKIELILSGKNVLFITTADITYIRNSQLLKIVRYNAKCFDVISPCNKKGVRPLNFSRLLFILIKAFFKSFKSYDLILFGGIPQLLVPFLSRKLKDKKIVVDFFVSLYDTLVNDREKISSSSMFASLLEWFDNYTLKLASVIITDTNTHGEYFADKYSISKQKMITLYLEADSEIYSARIAKRPKCFENKFLVFFFGAMNPLQGVSVIFKAAEILKEKTMIHFVFVGPYNKIASVGKYKTLKNITFYAEWLSQPEIADMIAMSDLCLAGHFNSDNEKAKRVIPGKAYIYLAMNKKIVLGKNRANLERFQINDKRVRYVPMGNAESLAGVIEKEACCE